MSSWNRQRGNENPCKDCKDRHLGCHSCCEKYIKWSEEREKFLKKQTLQKSITDAIMSNQSNRVEDMRRGRKRRG